MDHIARRLGLRTAATIGLLVLAGCGGGESDDPSEGSLVSVSGADYSFDAPDTVDEGPTTIRLTNEGKEDHELHLLRLNATLRLGSTVGHVPTLGPGETAEAAVELREGTYVLICQLPSSADGVAHVLKGMAKPLTVTAGR